MKYVQPENLKAKDGKLRQINPNPSQGSRQLLLWKPRRVR
jgi:hypothetical protein